MQPSRYRLISETLGIVRDNDLPPALVMLPEGSRVTISNAKAGSRMIDVIWEGAVITIFTQDLDERGILEDPANDTRIEAAKTASEPVLP